LEEFDEDSDFIHTQFVDRIDDSNYHNSWTSFKRGRSYIIGTLFAH
jgi:hypothetical protein